jgi:hypothetical protein
MNGALLVQASPISNFLKWAMVQNGRPIRPPSIERGTVNSPTGDPALHLAEAWLLLSLPRFDRMRAVVVAAVEPDSSSLRLEPPLT